MKAGDIAKIPDLPLTDPYTDPCLYSGSDQATPLPGCVDPPLTLRHGMPQATPPDAGRPDVVPAGHVELEGDGESPDHVVRENESSADAERPDHMVADTRGDRVQSPKDSKLDHQAVPTRHRQPPEQYGHNVGFD